MKNPEEWKASRIKTVSKTYNEVSSAPVQAFKWVITFFQKYISPMDGPRCQLYPTCSRYGKEAFIKNGVILGYFMTTDRLMRDNSGVSGHYPVIKKGENYYYYDPVEDNDFWF